MSTIRVSPSGHTILKELSKKFDKSIPQVLDMLIQKYEEEVFFNELNESVKEAKKDKELWKEIKAEQIALEGTLQDGLEDDAPYYSKEELKKILE